MSSSKSKKRPILKTPKGILSWPKLRKPNTHFKAEGKYEAPLVLDADNTEKLNKILSSVMEESKAAAEEWHNSKPKSFRDEKPLKAMKFCKKVYDEDDNFTGEHIFKFTMNASGVDKETQKPWSQSPKLYDAKGKPLPAQIDPWGGSSAKVAFIAVPYISAKDAEYGISLKLKAVQIIDLVSAGEHSASSFGFGEEDGYEYEPDEFETLGEDVEEKETETKVAVDF